MENPNLNFLSPSIFIPGNKKNYLDLIIHEMAHSWSGNLVTCKNWENLWLNEGVTMYLENKIYKEIIKND
jgi:leukotriene-A4 hydrolase